MILLDKPYVSERFASWFTTDVAHYAYGINPYACYFRQAAPDWAEILAQGDEHLYSIVVLDKPADVKANSITGRLTSCNKGSCRLLACTHSVLLAISVMCLTGADLARQRLDHHCFKDARVQMKMVRRSDWVRTAREVEMTMALETEAKQTWYFWANM